MLSLLFYLIISTFAFAIGHDLTQGIVSTCKDARATRSINHRVAHCDIISWQYANAYYKDDFNVYNPGLFLSPIEHLQYAIYVENQILGNYSTSKTCNEYVTYFACVDTYPHCPISGDSLNTASYFETCKLQCLLVNNNCPFDMNCTQYATDNCDLYIPSAYVALPVEYGEFTSIVTMYIWLLPIWVVFTFYWNIADADWEFSLLLSYSVRHIPTLKAVVVAICVAYWQTCNDWLICSYWLGISIINLHLVHLAGMMFLYCMIANGFGILHPTLPPAKWKSMMLLLFAFYMANSTMVVLQSAISRFSFYVSNCVIYGSVYLYIVINTIETIGIFSKQVVVIERNSNHRALAGDSGSESSDEEIPLYNDTYMDDLGGMEQRTDFRGNGNRIVVGDGDGIWINILKCVSRWVSICCYYSKHYHGVVPNHTTIKDKIKFQFYYRRDMYICFLILIFINILCEYYTHVLLMGNTEGFVEFWLVLMCYEISNVVCIVMIMYIYRPKNVSPLFYAMPILSGGSDTRRGFDNNDGDVNEDGWLNPRGTRNMLQTPSTVEVRPQRSQAPGAIIVHTNNNTSISNSNSVGRHSQNSINLTSLIPAQTRNTTDPDNHVDNVHDDIEMRGLEFSTSNRTRRPVGLTVIRQPDRDIVMGLDVDS